MSDPIIDELRRLLRGPVIGPEDADYAAASAVHNAMIDRRPRAILRCADVADIIYAVSFAGRHKEIPVAVRGGGHSGPGLGLVDHGLVIDLSLLRGIRVDPRMKTMRVDGGARWGDVDHATHAFGLAVPSGIISTVGVGGLALGGGHGHLTRRYGLTIDNLLAADIVLADGSFVAASETEHEDLFWAVRGGGGNFGVVTSFLFQLHPVTSVTAGPTLWPINQAAEVLRWYRAFLPAAPHELNGFFLIFDVPAAPIFPADIHGKRMAGIYWCHLGPAAAAHRLLDAAKHVGQPALHAIAEMSYPALQSAFDGLYGPGLQWYWRGHFLRTITDDGIATHVAFGERMPPGMSTTHIYPIDGAPHRIAADATAFGHRDAVWSQVIAGIDPDPARASEVKDWARAYSSALRACSQGGGYVNFLMDEDADWLKASYGASHERLARLKARYDPENLFRSNQNILPSSGTAGTPAGVPRA